MLKNKLYDILFSEKEDSNSFDLDDEEKDELDKKIGIIDKELSKFIDKRVHPKSKDKLKDLLNEYTLAYLTYFRRENQLFYANGISDGVKFILNALTIK